MRVNMEWLVGIAAFYAGVVVGLMVYAFCDAAHRADMEPGDEE